MLIEKETSCKIGMTHGFMIIITEAWVFRLKIGKRMMIYYVLIVIIVLCILAYFPTYLIYGSNYRLPNLSEYFVC